jgi:hypothetical protein
MDTVIFNGNVAIKSTKQIKQGDKVTIGRGSGDKIACPLSTIQAGDKLAIVRLESGDKLAVEGGMVWAFFYDVTYGPFMTAGECPKGLPYCGFISESGESVEMVYSRTFAGVSQLKVQLAGLKGEYIVSFGDESQTFNADVNSLSNYPNSWNKAQFSFGNGGSNSNFQIKVKSLYNPKTNYYEFTYPGICMWVLVSSEIAKGKAYTIQNPPF